MQDERIEWIDRGVWACLWTCADYASGLTRPVTADEIAALAHISRARVFTAIERLRTTGWLGRESGKQHHANRYVLHQQSTESTTEQSIMQTSRKQTSRKQTTQAASSPESELLPAMVRSPRNGRLKPPVVHSVDSNSESTFSEGTKGEPPSASHSPPLLVPSPLLILHGRMEPLRNYRPTAEFFDKVIEKYKHVDLDEESLKMADWLQRHPRRDASNAFILGWLGRAAEHLPAQRNGNGKDYAYANGRRGVLSRTQPDNAAIARGIAVTGARVISDETVRNDPELQKRLGVIP